MKRGAAAPRTRVVPGRSRARAPGLRSGTCLLLALLGAGPFGAEARAIDHAQWRVYRAADGLAESFALSLTVSPRGNVWVRHSAVRSISWLDGYQARRLPAAGETAYPVHESRSGQIWALYPAGLVEYRRDQWVPYPVDEIRAELQTNAFRLIRPIPLLPAERDHVLVLLPRQLTRHGPASGRTTVLRRADETALGMFIDLVEARDGGAWLAGSRGVAKLPGPIRALAPGTAWEEHPADPAWGVTALGRPFEDDNGGVVLTAETAQEGERFAVVLEGNRWGLPRRAPEGTRAIWRTAGPRLWAVAKGSLHTAVDGGWETVEIPGLTGAQIFDVAVEPNNVFWLATSAGVARHAPQTWRVPDALGDDRPDVRGLLEDAAGALWGASPAGLHQLADGRWGTVTWPPGFTLATGGGRVLAELRGGRIAVAGAGQVLLFDQAGGRFELLTHPGGRDVQALLGSYRPGEALILTRGTGPAGARWLEVFDGATFRAAAALPRDGNAAGDPTFADVTSGDRIWLGTTNGLTAWDVPAGTFTPLAGAPVGLPRAVVERANGRLWCGGDGVISAYDGRSWVVVRTGMGRVYALRAARDGGVWVASDQGVLSHMDGTWLTYGVEEGLPDGPAWDVIPGRDGALWVATRRGIYAYHREADLDEPRGRVAFSPSDRSRPATEPLTVRVDGRDKWDYTPPGRLLQSWRLDDGPWSAFAASPAATFSRVAPGDHRVEVRTMDRNRNEQAEPASWAFEAFVPWYAEPRLMALALAALVVAGSLAGLAVNRHLRLVRSHAEVERIVEQRTRQLEAANRELLHSQKMRALGTLAAGIAHDFNNILSIIKGSAQVIETNLDDREKIRTRVDRITTMVEQGSGIVKTMLGFSRVPALEARPCDPAQLVAETARLVADQLGDRITVRCRAAPGLPLVRGPAELVRQILLNLLFNAAEAMGGQGEIELTAELVATVPPNLVLAPAAAARYVALVVRDQGHGIAPEILPRLFEPFFTTKALSAHRGTGLGLSMAYEIAKELGLGVRVQSVADAGATFSLILPADLIPAPPAG